MSSRIGALFLGLCGGALLASEGTGATLLSGPMLGPVELRTAMIWTQTTDEASVQILYHPSEHPELAVLTDPAYTESEGHHIATFTLGLLDPGTTYEYEVFVDGVLQAAPGVRTLTTQPLWSFRTDPPAFRVLIGSCSYVNEPAFDRPGKPYGSHHEMFTTLAAEEADLMIWMGDNVYTREADYFHPLGLAHRYRNNRALAELQPLLQAFPHYATWDDHDYGPNNSDKFYPFKEASLSLFQSYWPAPKYGVPEAQGAFQRFTWADIDFFLCDDRFYRLPDTWPQGPDKTLLGAVQKEWLKGSLLSSRAPFKFVVLGNQVLNSETRYETMAKYEDELEEILSFISEQRIEGVIFLSGDRHHTELLKIDRPGMYPLYEFTSSPLTAGASRRKKSDDEYNNPLRVEGTFVHGEHSFGALEIAGPRTKRVLTMRAFDREGGEKWSQTVAAQDLRFPRN